MVQGDHKNLRLISFSAPFLSLFYTAGQWRPGMPIWIGNGTDATIGNRLLTLPFASSKIWPFLDAQDVLGTLGADVPISTAINNTARFPYLDPTGELVPPRQNGTTQRGTHEIEDGGYFDNSGLQTAKDLADWLTRAGPGLLPSNFPKGATVHPIIVLATAGGEDIPVDTIPRCQPFQDNPTAAGKIGLPVQALAPILSLYSLRGGHAAILIREVRQDFCSDASSPSYRCDNNRGLPLRCTTLQGRDERFFHFYLPAQEGKPVPLNWVLSAATSHFIRTEAMQQAGNPEEDWLMSQSFRQSLTVEAAK